MDGGGSWDVLDWTKIEEPIGRPMTHNSSEHLLESESVISQGFGVILINTDEAGTLLVTNFRLLFMSEVSGNIIPLGTIPLTTIEKFSKLATKVASTPRHADKAPTYRLLQVICKDMRIIVFGFRPQSKQRRHIFDALWRYTSPTCLQELYAFGGGSSMFSNIDPKEGLLNEYCRLLHVTQDKLLGTKSVDGPPILSNKWWRISAVNSNYTLCPTYPYLLIMPKCISDEEVRQASKFRARCRIPVISWCNPVTGAVIARSSQPLVGLMMSTRSNADEKLVAALCTHIAGEKGSRRKLFIADARPRKNALANGAMGGGSESSANYFQSEVVFFGIDNIHAMRESFARLRDYLDMYGVNSSDGQSSFLRNSGWTWGGGNLSSMSASVSTLGDSGWLIHVQSVLAGSAWIAARIAKGSSSVLVHCSDGWDRTSQLVSLASLMLDPYYRTFKGFQALVEKDWLAFGHPFSDRLGMPSMLASSCPVELSRQFSTGSISSSPMRTSTASASSHGQITSNYSPIFMQWVDCISQLLRMYPCAFEFSSAFLVDFLDNVMSTRFGNFLCNSEKERQEANIFDSCGCIWMYLSNLRESEGFSHIHYNVFYDPVKYDGPLVPPAAALAPTLWPQFHLRWACPMEAQAEELVGQYRSMANRLTQIQKAKDMAEAKAKDVIHSMESLTVELMKEKRLSSSAMDLAKRACRESLSIKRAIQTLGCKVHFSNSGDCSLDVVDKPLATKQKTAYPSMNRMDEGKHEEKSNLSLSISLVEGSVKSEEASSWKCNNLCPYRTSEGCKWPESKCALSGSQFVGLKANFDAFDQLSIYDCYFTSD